ncbi:FAD-dependent oxidoreductase [Sesbania bispinosa]|nr:FAD-dependent oxidoreductase [Sesbania bispinosa]
MAATDLPAARRRDGGVRLATSRGCKSDAHSGAVTVWVAGAAARSALGCERQRARLSPVKAVTTDSGWTRKMHGDATTAWPWWRTPTLRWQIAAGDGARGYCEPRRERRTQ